MNVTDTTVTEMTESLTGFEEIAIEKHMGIDVYAEGEAKPLRVMRALIFAYLTREGMSAHEAKDAAQGLPMKACLDYFADDPAELDDDDPETPVGEGASAAE